MPILSRIKTFVEKSDQLGRFKDSIALDYSDAKELLKIIHTYNKDEWCTCTDPEWDGEYTDPRCLICDKKME